MDHSTAPRDSEPRRAQHGSAATPTIARLGFGVPASPGAGMGGYTKLQLPRSLPSRTGAPIAQRSRPFPRAAIDPSASPVAASSRPFIDRRPCQRLPLRPARSHIPRPRPRARRPDRRAVRHLQTRPQQAGPSCDPVRSHCPSEAPFARLRSKPPRDASDLASIPSRRRHALPASVTIYASVFHPDARHLCSWLHHRPLGPRHPPV